MNLINIFLYIILICSIVSCGKKTQNKNIEKPDFSNAPVAIEILKIASREFENTIRVNGSIIASEEVDLRSEVSGKIVQIYFTEGSNVIENQLLIKLNDIDLSAQLKKLELKRKLADETAERKKLLFDKGGISKENLDNAVSELNSLIADIEIMTAQIYKTEIRAPFDGIIGLKYVSPGSYLTPATRIASVQKINPVKIEFSVPQKYYSNIQIGEKIKLKLNNIEKSYTAEIYAVEPKIDPATRTLLIRAICQNNKFELKPGSYTEIDVLLSKIPDAIMIPTEALLQDINGERVYLYKDDKAILTKVQTGIRTEKEIQIIRGLKDDDDLIISGLIQLRPNAPVKINKRN